MDKDKKDKDKDKEKEKDPKRADGALDTAANSAVDDLYRRLQPEMRRPKPGPDAIAAALEAAQRLAAEADVEDAAADPDDSSPLICRVCGYHLREGAKFCGMCGLSVNEPAQPASSQPDALRAMIRRPSSPSEIEGEVRPRPTGNETHHYHHHYHHHYFPGGQEAAVGRPGGEAAREPERQRPSAALRGEMSRAEAAVRRITHEWVLACNTKHLDDLLELYVADALLLRSNYLPIRGAAAVREFFFGALDAGLGDVEFDPLRLEVAGDLAYEAGRYKALVPSATGKRREERGKYLWVCARQGSGEWALTADCWSSDLSLTMLESDVPQNTAVRTNQPRKGS